MKEETAQPVPNPGLLEALKGMGYVPTASEQGIADAAESPSEDPMGLLNMDQHDESGIKRYDLPEGMIEEISPPEKERELRGELVTKDSLKKNHWVRDLPGYGTVGVTDDEKDAYVDALMNDARFEIIIPVSFGKRTVDVRVRSLYTSEKEVIALAVKKCVEKHPLKSNSGDLGQAMHESSLGTAFLFRSWITCQIVSWNGGPSIEGLETFDAKVEPGKRPADSPYVDKLAEIVSISFGDAHQARTKALIRAIQIFETKQLIMEDAAGNRDFWNPAGAS